MHCRSTFPSTLHFCHHRRVACTARYTVIRKIAQPCKPHYYSVLTRTNDLPSPILVRQLQITKSHSVRGIAPRIPHALWHRPFGWHSSSVSLSIRPVPVPVPETQLRK